MYLKYTKKLKTIRNLILFSILSYSLYGCAAAGVAISKRNLDIQTKMTKTIWLDPVDSPRQKTIYLSIKNTSDKPNFQLSNLKAKLIDKGYKVYTTDSWRAHYWLQVNIREIGRTAQTASELAAKQGSATGVEGGAIAGAATGALIAPGSPRTIVGIGLLGAAASIVANNLVKDVIYGCATDIRLSIKKGKRYKRINTRIFSTAEKVNLKFPEAKPGLERGITNSISGIF